jgi:hypothetical protein
MSAKPEVSRWTQGSEAPEGLLRLLEAGRGALGTPTEVAALARGLSRALGPAAGLPPPSEVAPEQELEIVPSHRVTPRQPLASARWLAGVTGGVVTGVAIWWSSGVGPAEAPAPAPAASSTSVAAQPSLPQVQVEVPLVAAPPLQPALAAAKPAPPSAAKRKSTAAPLGPSEAELLERAEAALSSDPRRALTLTREHVQRFPEGALAQEREVIAIEALKRTGKKQAAAARARVFARRYRGSVHETRLENAAPERGLPTPVTEPRRITPK